MRKLEVKTASKLVSNLSDFLRAVESIQIKDGYSSMFRGHSDVKYQLQASAFRPDKDYSSREDEMFYSLMASHPNEFGPLGSTFDRLVHAQHHGLPTRLLDVSRSPLVALYFAVENLSLTNAHVISFQISATRVKNFDSDTLTCICNLSKLTLSEKEEIRDWIVNRKRKSGKVPTTVAAFNNLKPVKRLVQLIKNEKPYFTNNIRPIDLWSNYLAMPSRSSPRVVAQSGAFLVSGIITKLGNSSKIEIDNIEISAEGKLGILQDLDKIGINRMSIYPSLESTAKYLSVDQTALRQEK